MDQKQRNLELLISDVIQSIGSNAPNFKYIYLGCRNHSYGYGIPVRHAGKTEIINSTELTIIDYDDSKLCYDYRQHGFNPSDDAKEQLAKTISEKFNGICNKKMENVSQDRHSSWVVSHYEIIAHDGIQEMINIQKNREKIKNC